MAAIGAGGMGEVYRAHDPHLGRDVALKVLGRRPVLDPARLRLFEQEARASAALSHPNIVAIYDTASEPEPYVVYELLEGETLRERIRGGRLTARKALDYAVQIAHGLAAAHAKGIVHRDLKPENVFITRDGRAKILDFGLAELQVDGGEAEGDGSDVSTGATSGWHSPRGTAGYTAPELLSGDAGDARSDLFSFGVLLYEMLEQRRPFSGRGPTAMMAAIFSEDPEPLRRRGIPQGLERIVMRCLEKRPQERFQTAHDLGLALAAVQESRTRRRPLWMGLAATLVVGAIAVALAPAPRGAPPAGGGSAEPEVLPLTTTGGPEFEPALSPDGDRVAFVWDGGERVRNRDVYVKAIGTDRLFRITTDPMSECCVTWAPDGRRLAFLRVPPGGPAQIVVTSAAGGAETVVGEVEAWFGSALSWSPDGAHLAISDREDGRGPFAIQLLALADGSRRRLTPARPELAGDALPVFSPDGRQIAFTRLPANDPLTFAELSVVDLASGAVRPVWRENYVVGGLDWTADGNELVYSSNRGRGSPRVWRIRLEGGEPLPVEEDPPLSNAIGAEAYSQITRSFRISVARAGSRLAYPHSHYDTDVVAVARADTRRPPVPIVSSSRTDDAPRFSPDGHRIVFASSRGARHSQIWMADADGRNPTQLTSFATSSGSPAWSPDGNMVAFDVAPDGQQDIYIVDVETRAARRFTQERHTESVPSFSRDGRFVYFSSDRDGSVQVWRAPLAGGPPQPVTRQGGHIAREWIDGRTILYTKEGVPGLFRTTLDGGQEIRVSHRPQCKGYWAVAQDGVYVVDSVAPGGPWLHRLDPLTGADVRLGELPDGVACGESGLDVHPSGDRLAYVHAARRSELMLIDGFR